MISVDWMNFVRRTSGNSWPSEEDVNGFVSKVVGLFGVDIVAVNEGV